MKRPCVGTLSVAVFAAALVAAACTDGAAQRAMPCDEQFCFRDSSSNWEEIGGAQLIRESWVIFAARGDSIHAVATPRGGPTITGEPRSVDADIEAVDLREWRPIAQDSSKVFSARIPDRGTYSLTMLIYAEEKFESYELDLSRVTSNPTKDMLAPSGKIASVATEPDTTHWYALVPDQVVRGGLPRSEYPKWGIRPGPHRVLMTSDSVYHVCQLPCDRLSTVILKPGTVTSINR